MSTEDPAKKDPERHDKVEAVSLTPEEARRGKYVPYDRFQELLTDYRGNLREMATKEAGLAAASGRVQLLEGELETAQEAASWSTAAVSLATGGYSEKQARLVRMDFEAREAGEGGAKEDFPTWWKTHEADYGDVFQRAAPATKGKPAPADEVRTTRGKPREDAGAKPVNGQAFSDDQLLSMSMEDYEKNRTTILAQSLGGGGSS